MPSVITHAIVGLACGKAFAAQKMPRMFWRLTIICAIIPDIDVIAFRFGIPYSSMWGHRGFTHSLFFAVVAGLIAASIYCRNQGFFSRRWWSYLVFFSLVTSLDGILDAFTDGGLGVAFFAPFSSERFFFPWRPIHVSPISVKYFFTQYGLAALKSEILWVWLPAGIIVLTAWAIRKHIQKSG